MHTRVSPGAPLPHAGAGRRPLVLVHGAVISGTYFERIGELLSERYDVYVPDLPGQGRSDKPRRALRVPEFADALLAWMDRIGLERPALIGHSLGCQTVVDLAMRHPDRAERLVLMAPTVAPELRNAWSVLWRLAVDALRERKTLVLLELLDLARAGPVRGWQTMRAAFADRIEDKLPRVPHLTLVTCGSRDLLVPLAWAEEVARLLPAGRLHVIPRSPHASHYSDPADTLRPLLRFLRQPLPGAGAGHAPAARQAIGTLGPVDEV